MCNFLMMETQMNTGKCHISDDSCNTSFLPLFHGRYFSLDRQEALGEVVMCNKSNPRSCSYMQKIATQFRRNAFNLCCTEVLYIEMKMTTKEVNILQCKCVCVCVCVCFSTS